MMSASAPGQTCRTLAYTEVNLRSFLVESRDSFRMQSRYTSGRVCDTGMLAPDRRLLNCLCSSRRRCSERVWWRYATARVWHCVHTLSLPLTFAFIKDEILQDLTTESRPNVLPLNY